MSTGVTRRGLLKAAAGAALGGVAGAVSRVPGFGESGVAALREESKMEAQTKLPRWRGFNLLEMFTTQSREDWQEDDFRWMADWGFDFVRLPMCYTLWIEQDDPYKLSEQGLARVDRGLELGRKHRLHVCMNFHRGPGYSVNRERTEPFDLWKDQAALDAFCFHWAVFARRYKGVSPSQLSFDLINEPPKMEPEDYARVARAAAGAISEIDPDRLIIADGRDWGTTPCPELTDLGIAQSCRAYAPIGVSHYKASWMGRSEWAKPVWPGMEDAGRTWNREALEEFYRPWAELAEQGVGVHCGEGGAYNQTPHKVVLAWLRDVFEILKSHNIGWAVWNFRGSFGVLDSERVDVEYEDFHGHKLDRGLLGLLREM